MSVNRPEASQHSDAIEHIKFVVSGTLLALLAPSACRMGHGSSEGSLIMSHTRLTTLAVFVNVLGE